jgi:hypothetical protein
MNIYRLSLFLTPVSFRWTIPLIVKILGRQDSYPREEQIRGRSIGQEILQEVRQDVDWRVSKEDQREVAGRDNFCHLLQAGKSVAEKADRVI